LENEDISNGAHCRIEGITTGAREKVKKCCVLTFHTDPKKWLENFHHKWESKNDLEFLFINLLPNENI
jgi:hypothetical protein